MQSRTTISPPPSLRVPRQSLDDLISGGGGKAPGGRRPAAGGKSAARGSTRPARSTPYSRPSRGGSAGDSHLANTDVRDVAASDNPTLKVKGDSSLVVNQVNGTWKVKTDHLRPMFEEARRIIDENFDGGASLAYVRRELNSEADSLANVAITVGSQIGAGVNVCLLYTSDAADE